MQSFSQFQTLCLADELWKYQLPSGQEPETCLPQPKKLPSRAGKWQSMCRQDLGCLPTAPLPLDALPLWRAAAPKTEVEWVLCNPGCILGNGLESSCVKDSSLLAHARTSRFPVTSPSYPQSLCPYPSQGGIYNLLFAILSARNFL